MIALVAAAVFVIAALWTGIALLRPMPPHTIVMVTGPEGSAYYKFGELYRQRLARQGIDLQLLPTGGTVENLSRLRDPRSKAEVGFLQGGITSNDSAGLESLGTIAYEPLWFFSCGAVVGRDLSALRGKKMSIGAEGSGSKALVLELLRRNGSIRGLPKCSRSPLR